MEGYTLISTPLARAVAFLGAAAVVLSACGSSGSTAQDPSSSGKPVYGGTLTYLEDHQETCIDPQIGGDIPQAMIGQQYTDDIVYEGAGGKIEPWLAKSWTIAPNGLTYTFTFRNNVKFTDGTPVNAAAVKANFERVVNKKTGSSTDGGYIAPFFKSATVLSPYVLQVKLTTPDSSLLDVLAQGYFGIESPRAFGRGISANCLTPVGSGPECPQSVTMTTPAACWDMARRKISVSTAGRRGRWLVSGARESRDLPSCYGRCWSPSDRGQPTAGGRLPRCHFVLKSQYYRSI